MSIASVIQTALAPLNVPVAFHEYEGTKTTYITFYTYNSRGNLIADDEEQSTINSVQIDVYSKGNYGVIVKGVKELLKPYGFARLSEMELYETTTKTYRMSMSFSVSLDSEII